MKNLKAIYKKFQGVDAVVLHNPSNTFYLSGYQSDFAYVLLTSQGAFYFTDTRYTEEASAVIGDAAVVVPVTARDVYSVMRTYLDNAGAMKIGFENGFLVYDEYIKMKTAFAGKVLLGIDYTMSNIRAVKSREEISLIKKAAAINDKAFQRVLKKVKEGVTERQLAGEMEYQMKKLGADGVAFDTIVAFGSDSSKPHAHVSNKKLVSGMPVTIDFGCKYKGYCSDITRTFAFGRPDNEFIKIYEAVLGSNIAGIEAVKAGVTGRHVDGICREYLRNLGYEKYFLHGTGHGVGVDIHEAPTVNSNSDEVLNKNMIVTVEPGVYIEGLFGVRIEDLIIVDNDGCSVISRTDKKLLIL